MTDLRLERVAHDVLLLLDGDYKIHGNRTARISRASEIYFGLWRRGCGEGAGRWLVMVNVTAAAAAAAAAAVSDVIQIEMPLYKTTTTTSVRRHRRPPTRAA